MLLFLAFDPTFPPRCGLPRACSNSCPLSWWCHPTISSSVVPFSSCLQSFPASGSYPPRCGPYFLGSRITADGECSYQIKRCLLLGNKALTNLDSRIQLSYFTFTFHFHALEKKMATHSSVLAWRIPGTEDVNGVAQSRTQLKWLSRSSSNLDRISKAKTLLCQQRSI